MAQQQQPGQQGPNFQSAGMAGSDLMRAGAGTKLKLRDGSVIEIVENPQDGYWLLARFISSQDESRVGVQDMVFFEDVVGLAE
ncbi:MAG TPA: hypothetical protein VFB90_03075 [Dehalococcoidia bacterium]|nr:hypothetical protein [Dehalococcoidia bacterium]